MLNHDSVTSYPHIAPLIRTAREHSGLTQEQLAERLNISKRYVGRLETGSIPSVDLLFTLVTTLGIPGDDIFYPAPLSDPYRAKREQASRLLLRCSEPQLNVVLSVLTAMLENEVPQGIAEAAANTRKTAGGERSIAT